MERSEKCSAPDEAGRCYKSARDPQPEARGGRQFRGRLSPTRPDANRGLPWVQFDEIQRSHQPSRTPRRNPASAVGARRRSGRATLGGSQSCDAGESLPVQPPLGGPHFLRRYDCADKGQSVWDSRVAVSKTIGGEI